VAVRFSPGFLTSFGSLSGQECLALSLLYEEKTKIPKNRLNQVKFGKVTTPGANNPRME